MPFQIAGQLNVLLHPSNIIKSTQIWEYFRAAIANDMKRGIKWPTLNLLVIIHQDVGE